MKRWGIRWKIFSASQRKSYWAQLKGTNYMNLGIETETIEFKKSTSELKEGCASIASILNKHQEGVLYFGVRKDGEIVGQDVSESTMREISQAIGKKQGHAGLN